MNATRLSPNIDVVEGPGGARYILRCAGFRSSGMLLALGFVVRTPLAAAGVAAWFLWQHFRQVPPGLTALAGVYVAQMFFVARLPWILFRQHLWQQIVTHFGNGEMELEGGRLFSGNRAGMFRAGERRDVGEFQRIVVYVYEDPSVSPAGPDSSADRTIESNPVPPQSDGMSDNPAADGATPQVATDDEASEETRQPETQTERAVLAIEASTKNPWLLVDGFSRSETLTLAEDLHNRIEDFIDRHGSQAPIPRPTVIESDARVLYPPVSRDQYRRRKPWWIAIHLAGAVGLAALTAIVHRVGAWQVGLTKFAIILGWLLELLLLATTLALPGAAATESEPAVS